MAEKRDYYEVLGLSKDATKDQIRSAYRKLAKEYHPDINKSPDAPKKFQEVQEAYDVLSDDAKRAQYDRFGMAAFSQGSSTGGAGNPFQQGGFGGFGAEGFGDVDLGDIFSSFFGGGQRRRGPQGPQKGNDRILRVQISFMDAIKGREIEIPIDYEKPCTHCHGSGAERPDAYRTCPECGGRGRVVREMQTIFGVTRTESVCPRCGGRGKIVSEKCHECGGEGYSRQKTRLKVQVPAGINSGRQLKIPGYGERGSAGGPNGDLYVEVLVKKDPYFEREGNDIHVKVNVGMAECALGTKIRVRTVYGEEEVEVPAGTQPGAILRLRGKGVREGALRTGDEYVHLAIEVPRDLTARQKELLREFLKEGGAKRPFFDRKKG